MTARSFWPPAEATQVDYETLRAHLLGHGRLPDGLAAARFARRGVAWTPHIDPRVSVLAAGYQFLLDTTGQASPFSAVHGGVR